MSDAEHPDQHTDQHQDTDHGSEAPASRPSTPKGPDVPWGLAGFLILALLLVVFAVQNTQSVELRFLGFEGSYPLVIIIVTVVVVTVILDEILGFVMSRRRARRARDRKELERLRKQR
jgi:uncharacterized integral membrane protein